MVGDAGGIEPACTDAPDGARPRGERKDAKRRTPPSHDDGFEHKAQVQVASGTKYPRRESNSQKYPRRESNSQSPDPWSGALSIGPRGHCISCNRDKPNYVWWASYEWRLQNLNPRPITSLIIESLHPHLKRALRYFFSKRKLLKSLPLINRNIFENSSPAASAAQLALSRPRDAARARGVDAQARGCPHHLTNGAARRIRERPPRRSPRSLPP